MGSGNKLVNVGVWFRNNRPAVLSLAFVVMFMVTFFVFVADSASLWQKTEVSSVFGVIAAGLLAIVLYTKARLGTPTSIALSGLTSSLLVALYLKFSEPCPLSLTGQACEVADISSGVLLFSTIYLFVLASYWSLVLTRKLYGWAQPKMLFFFNKLYGSKAGRNFNYENKN